MADLRVVISALNKASGDLAKVKGDIKKLGDSGKTAEGGVKGLGAALGGAWKTALSATAAIAAVGTAIKATYDAAKEGAELQYAEDRFNNLAIAAGTAADVLLGDMREATKGMMSDAELVASGADLMALGLAKSHDEVVRLTSVAGALKMNMNQLVLTLTNQTTMRFDALGVSVDGFQEKVKALEAAGLSANDAFKEAFLQQAEEQILKVGSAADSSIGAFQRMEAAQANYFNGLKQDLVEAGTWWAQFWEGVYNDKIAVRAYESLIDQANALGINTRAIEMAVLGGEDYVKTMLEGTGLRYQDMKVTADQIEQNKAAVDALGEQVKYQSEMNTMRSRGTNANYEYSASEKLVANEIKSLSESFRSAYLDSTAGADAQFKFLTGNYKTYSGLLTEIEEKQTELANMKPWQKASESGRELQGEIDVLLDKLDDLGEAMKMDALKTAIEANGDVTEQEYQMMLNYMEDASIISKETNKEMMEDWRDLNQFQQSLRWDAEGNIIMIANEAFKTIERLKEEMRGIERHVGITVSVTEVGKLPRVVERYSDTGGNAVGGSVNAGNPYTWQEYGYRGEVFVPSADGFVLSRADAERALARALYGGGSAIDPAAIGKAVAQAMSGVTAKGKGGNVYNLTMPTSSNPADVRTAFELMEAWNA